MPNNTHNATHAKRLPSTRHDRESESTFVPKPSTWTDQVLLAKLLARDERAWVEFVRRFKRVIDSCIDSVVRRFTSVLSHADSADIYGQLMLGLQGRDMHRLRAFQAHRGVQLATWLGLLARNAAWDFLRAAARRAVHHGDLDATALESSCSDPERELLNKEAWAAALDALEDVSERDQAFLRLYYAEEHSPEQVARLMNISVVTVYTKNNKLRTRLRASLRRGGRGRARWCESRRRAPRSC